MLDREFDNDDLIEESRGILQKFNMLFQAELNSELQALLFQKVHRYTYASVSEALAAIAPESNSYQKPAELIGLLSKWLPEHGSVEPGEPVKRDDWWEIGVPILVKADGAHHPGWIYSKDLNTGAVMYRRNRVSRTWNIIYCPMFRALKGDGPEMPGPIQSLAVKLILSKFPIPKVVTEKGDRKSPSDFLKFLDGWRKKVDAFINSRPWDVSKAHRELALYRREKSLGHPLEPRGWDNYYGDDEGK